MKHEEDHPFKMNWQVYMVLCSDDSLYTGITTDVERRLHRHAIGKGAKYFRGRQPGRLVYLESGHNRSTASKKELKIKRLMPVDKFRLIFSECNEMGEKA
jgi:putative endonuclease